MKEYGSTSMRRMAKALVFGGLLVGSIFAAQSAGAATAKVTLPTTLTTCTVNGVTTVVPAGTFMCSDGVTAAVAWTNTTSTVTADRPYSGALKFCINTSTGTLGAISTTGSVSCKTTEVLTNWNRTWGKPNAPVVRNVNVTSATTAMVAYTDSTMNNGSQIYKYVITSNPGGVTATHFGAGSPTMKLSGLLPDTNYTFQVCATNAAGTTCATSSIVHTWPLAPQIALSSGTESQTYGNAIVGYTISELGGHSITPGYLSTYSISPSPENGLSFDSSTGLLTGTPVGVHSAATYTITETNISGSASGTFTLTVTPATLTITVTSGQGKVYGESDPAAYSYTSAGFVLSDTSSIITGSLSRDEGENVGSYAINQNDLSAGGNYTINFVGAPFDITPATLTVSADSGLSKVYGSVDPALTYSFSGFLFSDDSSLFTGALGRASGENVGTYAISQGDLSAGANYVLSFTGSDFTITPAILTVSADGGQGKVYGSDDPTFTFTPSGFVNGDTDSILTGSLSRDAGENVGTYAINQNDLSAGDNYVISYTGSDFTITPATLTVTVNSGQGKVFGSVDPASFTFTPAGFVNGDTSSILTGALSRDAGESVGAYAIKRNDLSAGDNYVITYVSDDFAITPATPSFGWSDVTKLSTDPDWTLTAPSSSTPGTFTYTSGNTSVVTISGSTVHIVGSGTAVITATFTPTDALDYVSGGTVEMTITVNPGVVTSVLSWSKDCTLSFPGGVSFRFCAATSTTAGTFTYSSSNGAVFTVDGGSLTGKVQGVGGYADLIATFTPADSAHATAGTVTLHLHLWLSGTAPSHADGSIA